MGELLELHQLLVRLRCAHQLDDIEPCQRAHAIAALGISELLQVGEFGVAVVLDRLANHLAEYGSGDAVGQDIALGIDHAQRAIGKFDRLVLVDQPHVVRWEVGEDLDLGLEVTGDLLVGGESHAQVGVGLGQHGKDLIPLGNGQRLGDAAGNYPAGMDALAGEQLDCVLAEAA